MKIKKIIFSIIIFSLIISPALVFAQESQPTHRNLPQPLGGGNVSDIVANIIQSLLGIVGVLALAMFVYGGITWMISGGSSEKIEQGKKTIVWAVLGLAIVFFSYAILDFILKTLIQ